MNLSSLNGVSICVVFQDNDIEIQRLVRSLQNIDLSSCVDLVAVDNCSRDPSTLSLFESLSCRKILVRNKKRMSLAYNRNQCVRLSSGSILLFLDSDTEFIQTDFLSRLIKNMEETGCDIAAPVILSPDGSIQSVGFRKSILTPYIVYPVKHVPERPERIQMIHGACFAIRRKVLLEIGLFDEFMEPYNFDEMDLAIRAFLRGYKMMNFGDLKIRHYGGGTTSRYKREQRALYFIRHGIRSIRRNYTGINRLLNEVIFIVGAQLVALKEYHSLESILLIPKAIKWNIQAPSPCYLYFQKSDVL